MILEKVVHLYDTELDLLKRRQPGKGNPTASQAGTCAAQLQMLRFPALTNPVMRPARTAWVFEDGDRAAADLRQKIERAIPGVSGLAEELFYLPVPIEPEPERALEKKIHDRSLWGSVRPGFVPPQISLGQNGGKDRLRLAERDPRNPERPRPMGFVIDPGSGILWAPLYVDLVFRHVGFHRLVVVEFKSMSRFGFRRALLGDMGYRERVQLAVIGEATGLDTVWFIKCKDTAHLLEIAFLRDAAQTRVTLLRSNGRQETYWVEGDRARPVGGGDLVELQEDETWEVGEVWTPRDARLLEEARARILRVLLFEPPAEPQARLRAWGREYGPDFTCETCEGTGTQTLAKNAPRAPLKKAKPCEDCGATGQLSEVELPAMPCGYCPVTTTCYPFARLELTTKPRYVVTREAWEASGLTFSAPKSAEPVEISG